MEKVRKDKDVIAVALFGSVVRKEKKISDIDVCLMLKPKKYDSLFMTEKRMEYLGLFPLDKFDVQIFQQLPVFIRIRILREGKFLLKRDEEAIFKIALSTIKEFELFRKHYYYCLKAIAYG